MYEAYTLAFVSSFLFVALKAAQQLNVVHKQYMWVLPTSMLMATCEVYVIAQAAVNGWGWIVLFIGAGSGLGAMVSMWLHGKLMELKECKANLGEKSC